jgi:hypothetical protein
MAWVIHLGGSPAQAQQQPRSTCSSRAPADSAAHLLLGALEARHLGLELLDPLAQLLPLLQRGAARQAPLHLLRARGARRPGVGAAGCRLLARLTGSLLARTLYSAAAGLKAGAGLACSSASSAGAGSQDSASISCSETGEGFMRRRLVRRDGSCW